MIFTAGIYENIRIEGVEKTDLGALKIILKQVDEESEENELAVFNSNTETLDGDSSGNLLLFPVTVGYNNEVNDAATIKAEIGIFRAKLNHILAQYMPISDIKYNDTLRDLDITVDNINEKIQDQNIVDIICERYIDDFVSMFESVDTTALMRLKLSRSSQSKHYGKIPKSTFGYKNNSAFIEPMTIAKDQSKIKFSDWEAKRGDYADRMGYDHSDPTPFEEDSVEGKEAEKTNELFGM